jgi:hypothetical protein
MNQLAELEFPAIAEEAERSALDAALRDQFARLTRVGALLQQLVPEDLDPASFDNYLDIVFHCFHFWSAGTPTYVVEADVLRSLIETPPDLGSWRLRAEHPSFYIELPRNLFWAAIADETPPEPVEGLFARPAAGQAADFLAVMGVRPDRPGFSVAGLSIPLEFERGPEDESAFRSDIPGADLAGLYSLARPSELVLLTLRLLWYLDLYPEAVESVKGAEEQQADAFDASTSLDHYRVYRVERSRE